MHACRDARHNPAQPGTRRGRLLERGRAEFSKKIENHSHMVALYTAWYNFVKMNRTRKMTPALAARVTDRLWSMDDLAALIDAWDEQQPRQKPQTAAGAV